MLSIVVFTFNLQKGMMLYLCVNSRLLLLLMFFQVAQCAHYNVQTISLHTLPRFLLGNIVTQLLWATGSSVKNKKDIPFIVKNFVSLLQVNKQLYNDCHLPYMQNIFFKHIQERYGDAEVEALIKKMSEPHNIPLSIHVFDQRYEAIGHVEDALELCLQRLHEISEQPLSTKAGYLASKVKVLENVSQRERALCKTIIEAANAFLYTNQRWILFGDEDEADLQLWVDNKELVPLEEVRQHCVTVLERMRSNWTPLILAEAPHFYDLQSEEGWCLFRRNTNTINDLYLLCNLVAFVGLQDKVWINFTEPAPSMQEKKALQNQEIKTDEIKEIYMWVHKNALQQFQEAFGCMLPVHESERLGNRFRCK